MADLGTRVAVITGAGSGLGSVMADLFAGEGMAVVALDIDGDRAGDTARRIVDAGGQALSARVDVADRESVDAAAKLASDAFGGCHILCANVGVQQFGAIDRLTEQDWQWVLNVNVMGMVHTVGAFLPLLRASAGDRHVVVTASSGALSPGVRLGAYQTSKYAVVGFGETLRLELADEGIGVSILFPAGMWTRHLESSAAARPEELGPSVTAPDDIDAMMASRKTNTVEHAATPEHAVRNLLAELRENRRYIITHGSYREQVEEHCSDLLAAYDRMAAG